VNISQPKLRSEKFNDDDDDDDNNNNNNKCGSSHYQSQFLLPLLPLLPSFLVLNEFFSFGLGWHQTANCLSLSSI